MKNLIGDMHQLKDFNDIDKSKKFTRSILFEKNKQDSITLKDYQFQTMKPVEDFVRPEDQFSPRQTGYEHGHIRSLLKLDAYGPAGSRAISRERELGNKPRSPNVDRHLVLSPDSTMRANGNGSLSSRASTAGSTNYNGAFPSLKSLRRDRDRGGMTGTSPGGTGTSERAPATGRSDQFNSSGLRNSSAQNTASGGFGTGTGNFGQSVTSNASPAQSSTGRYYNPGHTMAMLGLGELNLDAAHTRPGTGSTASSASQMLGARSTGRAGTAMSGLNRTGGTNGSKRSSKPPFPEQTFAGVAITADERLQGGDPFLRRTLYFKAHTSDLKVITIAVLVPLPILTLINLCAF